MKELIKKKINKKNKKKKKRKNSDTKEYILDDSHLYEAQEWAKLIYGNRCLNTDSFPGKEYTLGRGMRESPFLFCFLAALCSIQDPSSLIRDRTHDPHNRSSES